MDEPTTAETPSQTAIRTGGPEAYRDFSYGCSSRAVHDVFFDWLRAQRPELLPRYEKLYGKRAYAPPEERRRLARLVRGPDLAASERMRSSPRGLRFERGVREEPAPSLTRVQPQERLF